MGPGGRTALRVPTGLLVQGLTSLLTSGDRLNLKVDAQSLLKSKEAEAGRADRPEMPMFYPLPCSVATSCH